MGDSEQSKANPPPFRRRAYAHFDRPLSPAEVQALLDEPANVARHSFWPMVITPIRTLRRRPSDEDPKRREWAAKIRPVGYVAHLDAHIHAHYAALIREKLEVHYQAPFGTSILAYRQFPEARCNLHFAYEAFDEIRGRGACEAIALDVKGFFDSLDHQVLKSAWLTLLGVDRLPADHFAVFKSVTRDRAVLLPDLHKELGEVRRQSLRDGARICGPKVFRTRVRPLLRHRYQLVAELKGLKPDDEKYPRFPVGIAQGTPISANLANVYMLAIDQQLHAAMEALGGSYRRYSDDILLIVPPGRGQEAETLVQQALSEVKLQIAADKTCRVAFQPSDSGSHAFALGVNYERLRRGTLDYLGLSFDGQATRLRASTISRFMIRMSRAVRRAEKAAWREHDGRTKLGKPSEPQIKCRKLYATFASLGKGRAYGGEKGKEVAPRPGFHYYVQRASKLAEDVGHPASETIARQGRQLDQHLHQLVAKAKKRAKDGIKPRRGRGS